MDKLKLEQLITKEAGRLESDRQQRQGLGRPIVSRVSNGKRYVTVGKKTAVSPHWKTFIDFLHSYIASILLTNEWLRKQALKAEEERHPLFLWYDTVRLNREENSKRTNSNGVYRATMTGADKSLLRLAYDLYSIDHNAHLPAPLLSRLGVRIASPRNLTLTSLINSSKILP
ncbi:MAG: hypothetical protein K2X93_20905 [Candidatus Obscuribacterales bacterium]|nr:hypothetical protein [Candidatus Obscuribacterales bacterium]